MYETTKQPVSRSNQLHVTANALLDEAWNALERSETTFAQQLGQDALHLSKSIEPNYNLGCARSLFLLAECSHNEGQYGAAIAYASEAQLLYQDLQPDIYLARGLYTLGFSYEHLGNHSEALRIFHSLYDIAHRLESTIYKANALTRIGSLHVIRNQEDIALEYFQQCLSLYDSTDDRAGLADVYSNMSKIYHAQGQYEQALELAKRSLEVHQATGSIASRTFSHSSLARIYVAIGEYEQAEDHIDEALKLAQQAGYNHPQIIALQAASHVRHQMQQPIVALEYLHKALALAADARDRYEVSQCHHLLAEIYAELGEFRAAFYHHQEFHELRQSIWNESNQTRFESLEILYQTQQAQAEATLQRELREQDQHYYQKLSDIKNEIISTASHDLKNPLASLRLAVQVLAKHGRTDDPRGQELLQRIEKIIEQMRRLITDVLDIARLDTGLALTVVEHDYRAFLEALMSEYRIDAHHKHIDLQVEIDFDSYVLGFDVQRIQQVVDNLVSNALKYTASGGRIMVKAKVENGWIITRISDSGIGIPPADLPNIFERFYRVNSEPHNSIEGTGLGLAICKSIVEQHGGSISVESTIGKGSTFRFSLPAEGLIAGE